MPLLRVGYQGEPGAYSEEALRSVFPEAEPVGHRTFLQVVEALLGGGLERAILPVENTLGGIVQEVNDLLWERPGLRVVGEHVHPIRHCLLGRPGVAPSRALSHPQALAQVRHYLERNGIEPVPFHDTAGAARHLGERADPGLAAVASRAAAARYGLQVLAEDIQDDGSNRTRFLVLERGVPRRPGAGRPGDKTSLCVVTSHAPGGLVGALQCLSSRNVNLTRLEARPIPDKPFEYRFFLDFEVVEPAIAEAALGALETAAHEVRLFGTFPASGGQAPESRLG